MNCFYCDCELVAQSHNPGKTTPANASTWDHIIPRQTMHSKYALDQRQMNQNRVLSCHDCNNRKGGKDPLDFLTSHRLPNAGAERLRDKLHEIGAHQFEKIEAAFFRRERYRNGHGVD